MGAGQQAGGQRAVPGAFPLPQRAASGGAPTLQASLGKAAYTLPLIPSSLQLVYTAGVVLMFPAMVMAMAAGAVFGMVWGTVLVWLGSSVGQTLAFVVGR